MTKFRAILLFLIFGVAAFLFVQLFPGRRISHNFNAQPMAWTKPLRSRAISIRFAPNSQYLLVAGSVGKGSLGRYQNGEYLFDFRNQDKRLRLFEVANEKETERLKAEPMLGEQGGNSMVLMPDFKNLLTTTAFHDVKLIDVRKRTPDRLIDVRAISHHDYRETVTSMKVSPDGKILALGTIPGVQFYDAQNFRRLGGYEHAGGKGVAVSFGRKSDVVKLRFFGSRRPHFVSVKTGKRIPTPQLTREFEVTFSPDGKHFAEVKDLNQLEIWQRGQGKSQKLKTLDVDLVEIQTVQFSPDGKTLAVGGLSSTEIPVRFYKLSEFPRSK